MEGFNSKVYIQTDANGRVIRCEGGYTMSNIDDVAQWTCIDEGSGDRYNLCQSHYFESGLYTEDGLCRWVYENGACRRRTEAEVAADREARDAKLKEDEAERVANATDTVLLEMTADQETRLCLLEMGVSGSDL